MCSHIRYPSRTRRHTKELNKTSLVDKDNLELLLTAWKTLPEEEQNKYNVLKHFNRHSTRHNSSLYPLEAYQNENEERQSSKLRTRSSYRSKTIPFTKLENVIDTLSEIPQEMSEVHYKDSYFSEEYLSKLYISDLDSANDLGLLQKNQIFSILSIGKSNIPLKFPSVKGGYMTILFEDDDDIVLAMDNIFRIINNHIKKGNVLIHCCQGKSKSCAVVIGYLMKKFKSDYKTASNVLYKSRIGCEIDMKFERQLKRMERKCMIPE